MFGFHKNSIKPNISTRKMASFYKICVVKDSEENLELFLAIKPEAPNFHGFLKAIYNRLSELNAAPHYIYYEDWSGDKVIIQTESDFVLFEEHKIDKIFVVKNPPESVSSFIMTNNMATESSKCVDIGQPECMQDNILTKKRKAKRQRHRKIKRDFGLSTPNFAISYFAAATAHSVETEDLVMEDYAYDISLLRKFLIGQRLSPLELQKALEFSGTLSSELSNVISMMKMSIDECGSNEIEKSTGASSNSAKKDQLTEMSKFVNVEYDEIAEEDRFNYENEWNSILNDIENGTGVIDTRAVNDEAQMGSKSINDSIIASTSCGNTLNADNSEPEKVKANFSEEDSKDKSKSSNNEQMLFSSNFEKDIDAISTSAVYEEPGTITLNADIPNDLFLQKEKLRALKRKSNMVIPTSDQPGWAPQCGCTDCQLRYYDDQYDINGSILESAKRIHLRALRSLPNKKALGRPQRDADAPATASNDEYGNIETNVDAKSEDVAAEQDSPNNEWDFIDSNEFEENTGASSNTAKIYQLASNIDKIPDSKDDAHDDTLFVMVESKLNGIDIDEKPNEEPQNYAVDDTEKEAPQVHPDDHVNAAILALSDMGFTNENGNLVKILELVHGNIDLALELLPTDPMCN
ncbi:uncharacterized protein LOC116341676 isoform X2 [Contarinia nasturtii]|uniref:uncharacterized protein LOC116341676 isoform X2 n=1 Tax=Contarinia nasturtii TaxID=265458 RepID=UPI0012D382A8|nr:uncharacterized protein LOC116341676 isoform X2 [Contarinia nasturtii]